MLVVGMLAACAGDEPIDVEARCAKVLDRVIALRLAEENEVDRDAHAKAMRSAFGADVVASCATKMTDTQRDCLLAATTSAAASACTNP